MTLDVLLNFGNGTFRPATSLPLTDYATGLAVGDFNGDGRADVAANVGGDIIVFLADPSGNLRERCRLPNFGNPLVGDFDGDGWDDVVSSGALFAPSFAALGGLYLGNGDGTFETLRSLPTGSATHFTLADLNADGRLDLVWLGTNGFGGMISDGAGGFSNPVFTAYTDFPPQEVVFADVTGDGRADAIALSFHPADSSWRLSVRQGIGNGGFGPEIITMLPSYPYGMVVADFDGDGHKDVALYLNRQVVVAHGDGRGGFSFSKTPQTIPFGSLIAADLNGDGIADLVVVAEYHDHITVLLNDGTGTFRTGADLSMAFTTATLLDVDGDGKPDLVTTTTQSVVVHKGDGKGNFGAAQETLVEGGGGFVAADFDGDGHLDLLTGFPATLLKGRGDGSFVVNGTYPLPVGTWLAGDVTGDGKPDLLGTLNGFTWLIPNTTCEPRRLQLEASERTCGTAGAQLTAQPVIRVLDDAGNLIACETGSVTASLLPGSGPAGALLGGITSVPLSGGIARFSNLSIDKGGGGYRLRFELAGTRATSTPWFSQSLPSPVIVGPTQICSSSSTRFDGGAGPGSWVWTLDGTIVGTGRFLTLPRIAFGTHTLGLTIREDACTSATSISILVSAPPCPQEPHKPAQLPVPGFPVSRRPPH